MVFFVYAKILRFFKKALEKQKNALRLQYTIKLIHTDMKRFVVFTIMLMVALTASAKGKCDWKGKVEWGRTLQNDGTTLIKTDVYENGILVDKLSTVTSDVSFYGSLWRRCFRVTKKPPFFTPAGI